MGTDQAVGAILITQVALEGPLTTGLKMLGDTALQNATEKLQKDASNYLANDVLKANEEQNKEVQKAYYNLSDVMASMGVETVFGGAYGMIRDAKKVTDAIDFSGGKPIIKDDPYSPDIVNDRSSQFYNIYDGTNPLRGSMSNLEVRQWYLNQEKKIPELIDQTKPIEEQAKQAFNLRNQFRTEARDAMQDRITADRLFLEETNMTWEKILEKTKNNLVRSGVEPSNNNIYNAIINSSQRSRTSVNNSLGVQ